MLGSSQRNAVEEMRRRELMTATPAQLTVKLFQRLLLDLHRAAADLGAGQPGAASSHLVHAQAILTELDSTLDVNAWSGAADLKAVYGYCLNTIAAANRDSDPAGVASALDLLTPVAEAFTQAARTSGTPS
ncbi:flagellar export chaperone FliS [Citricoccus sp. GCM10030269]|uniref:flagellar export chaperone FliS n=1 Tax=Citricoccus sp. GCM10030269 TaxID=3273388 RepID=UPI0036222C47